MPDDLTVTATPQRMASDIDEETFASEPHRAVNFQAIWRRVSRLGVIVVLIVSLAFVLKDVSPTEVFERLADMAGSLPTRFGLSEVSEQIFLVSFSRDSDILEPDNWSVLDSAVVILNEQPDSIALIADLPRDPRSELYNLEISRARTAAVERYLLAAGVDRHRLHVEGRTVPDGLAENGLSHLDVAEKMNRIVRINLDSKSSQ